MANPFSDPEMQEIFEGYLVETQELLESLSQDLMVLENHPNDMDLLNRIFRSFHTIKGTSSFMGFSHISEITHHAEDILNKLRRSELIVNQPIIDVLLEVQDWIVVLIDKVQEGDLSGVDYAETIKILEVLKTGQVLVESPSPTSQNSNNSKPLPEISGSAIDNVLSSKDFGTSPGGDFTDEEEALLQLAFLEINKSFAETSSNPNEVIESENNDNHDFAEDVVDEDVLEEIDSDFEEIISAPVEPKIENQVANTTVQNSGPPKTLAQDKPNQEISSTKNKTAETIRIDVERVETLMDLSGELVLGRNRLAQLTTSLDSAITNKEQLRDLIETTSQIDFITSEIQSAVMRMRMVPVGKLYQKAPRIVRDLAKEFGKNIKLVVKGEETEIDRGIIEELNDPLVHMIRNSCDHGVEFPNERTAVGKPAEGTIILDAEQEGNNIVLRISDDGKGMDPEKLKAKAIEKGLITFEQANQMPAREAFQLIFAPGFSTAVKVSAVSGRGVGMDVVRTNIQKLKGMIEIESEVNKGTTFIVKLPLTLAIIQGLLVKVMGETYAIPLSSVIEVVSLNQDEVYSVNKQEVIRIRKDVLPILRLDHALNCKSKKEDLSNRYVVTVGFGVQKIGLVVDELLGQQEIVIKSLGEYLGSVPGIAGSTILGDGRVIMIIDIAQLIQNIFSNEYLNYNG